MNAAFATAAAPALSDRLHVVRPVRQPEAPPFVGSDPAVQSLLARADRLAPTPVPLMLLGESGSGKEVLARRIHARSSVSQGPFVAENCAAIPEALFESELFGHVRGAFTGADRDRDGLFQRADGGTLLLDEIGDAPLAVQAKLLRVLEQGCVRPVGGQRDVPVRVRVLSATHRDPAALVSSGRFREDLFHRLHGAALHLPALRERADDIEELARYFLAPLDFAHGTRSELSTAMLERWRRAPWPGNVRELRHRVQSCYHLCDGPVLDDAGLEAGPLVTRTREGESLVTRVATLNEIEHDALLLALRESNGNRDLAARRLGISRSSIYQRIRRHGLET